MAIKNLAKSELIKKILRLERRLKRYELNGTPYSKESLPQKNNFREILEKTTHDLGERVKELTCLYKISNLLNNPIIKTEKIYPKILDIIIPSYQYPEITVVRLILEGKYYISKNFRKTKWKQSNPIAVQGEKIGELEIYYLNKCTKSDEGPFLKEERNLINSITLLISQFVERKRIYEALQQSELKFKTLIEKAPMGIGITRKGFYIYVNKKFLEMYGFKNPNELIGKSLIGQVAPRFREEITKRIGLRDKKLPVPDRYECMCIKKNGEQFPIINVVTEVNLEDGIAQLAFAADITDRKKAEDAINESRIQLKSFAEHLQTVREEERIYISRELHDNLGQSLTALKIELFRTMKKITEEYKYNLPESIVKQIQSTITLVDGIIQSTRNIARNLRPVILDDIGLLAAIEWQTGEFEKRSGIKCKLITTLKEIPMEKVHSIGVFRIIQEALTNVMRHSRADSVSIKIGENGNNTLLRISDNGCGINESDINNANTMGIIGMRERAQVFGGEINIKGRKDKGTEIILKIPKN